MVAGPRLRFVFGLSDLNRARYAEAWLPANLIFDQFALTWRSSVNTMAAHSVITNGAGHRAGHQSLALEFPSRFSALSPLLEIRASDTLELQTDTTVLPVSGTALRSKLGSSSGSAVNLTAQINTLEDPTRRQRDRLRPVPNGNRYVAFFNARRHGVRGRHHHLHRRAAARDIPQLVRARDQTCLPSRRLVGRGLHQLPRRRRRRRVPFDFLDAPVVLCSRDPFQRNTPANSYSDGSRFFRGMAALLGVAQLNALMRDLYVAHKGHPVSTAMIEEFLLCKSGNAQVVDAFHRFVYGFGDPSPAPDLWLRDDPGDPGADAWGGAFWDSPDLWIRNDDDGGTTHQSPEYGQDNWFYARVRNKGGAGAANTSSSPSTQGFRRHTVSISGRFPAVHRRASRVRPCSRRHPHR